MNAKPLRSALLVAAVAGCAAAETTPAPRVGAPALEYAAPTLAGDTVSLASMRGEVVLLNFWATWCPPCRAETPFLQSLYEENRERGFHVVGVSMDTRSATDQIPMFVDEYGVTYTVLHDADMRGMDVWQIIGLPATFLIDREGTLRWMRYGPLSETDSEFRAAVEDALR